MPTSPPFLPVTHHFDGPAPGRMLSLHRPEGVTPMPPATPSPSGPFHLLLVEKDPAMRAMLTGMLAGPGYDVAAAGDNLEAAHAVARRRPDLVIVDLYLREPGSLDFVRALRADPATAEVPVILLTASADPAHGAENRPRNIRFTLYKPFGMKELLDNVRSALPEAAAAPPARP